MRSWEGAASQVLEPPLNRNKEAKSTDPQPIPTDSAKKEARVTEEPQDLNVSLCKSSDIACGVLHFLHSLTQKLFNYGVLPSLSV